MGQQTRSLWGDIAIALQTTGVANRFIVRDSGNVQNTNNSYTGISDIKLKENVVDASSQWADMKSLQVRNYNFKEETSTYPSPNPPTATKTATTLALSPRASTTRCST
jgi:hypothetical protein